LRVAPGDKVERNTVMLTIIWFLMLYNLWYNCLILCS
jgi:hypothetical protein